MRIDAHQHFWTLQRGDYTWLNAGHGKLYRDYLPYDLDPQLKKAGIDRTIVVQAASTMAESAFLLELASTTSFIAGVVGWVDMESGSVAEDLDTLSRHPLFLGIRPMIQDIADLNWMCRGNLSTAYHALIERDLTFDALIREEHLPNLVKVMEQHSDLRVVVDHCAKPDIGSRSYTNWAQWIKEVAANPKAHCKLSGLLTEAGAYKTREEIQPYVDHVINCFGTARLMWGSDWPVLRQVGEYENWLVLTDELLAGLTDNQCQEIMGKTAARFYQLDWLASQEKGKS